MILFSYWLHYSDVNMSAMASTNGNSTVVMCPAKQTNKNNKTNQTNKQNEKKQKTMRVNMMICIPPQIRLTAIIMTWDCCGYSIVRGMSNEHWIKFDFVLVIRGAYTINQAVKLCRYWSGSLLVSVKRWSDYPVAIKRTIMGYPARLWRPLYWPLLWCSKSWYPIYSAVPL